MPEHGAGNRWFANVPLALEKPVPLQVSFQNGGRVDSASVSWKPVNLFDAPDLTIRQGDALLLTASPTNAPIANSMSADIEILGVTRYNGAPAQGISHRFVQAGVFQIQGTTLTDQGAVQSRPVLVKVVAASFPAERPAAWVDKPRVWNCPALPQQVVIEADPRLKVEAMKPQTDVGRDLQLTIDAPEPRYVLARLGERGPILAGAQVDGFRVYSGLETDFNLVTLLPDASRLVEMGVVMEPVYPKSVFRFPFG